MNIANKIESNGVKAEDKLKNFEDEVDKDYSKYVAEYGLSKTAFAKAVNQIREK